MEDRLPQNYIPVHYDLYMHIVENQYPFDAIVTITFQKQQTNTKLYLNIDPSIQIKRIMQNNIDLKYKIDYPKLIIKRSKNIKMDFDSYPITIEYQVTPNQGYNRSSSGNYFPPGNSIQSSLCDEYPCVLNKPSGEKPFQFDRYVPYDHIHADLEACSIKPKPKANSTYVRRGCSSSSNKVNSAISHLDAAKRILSSA